jgi:S-adenosylmethionine:tRNA ribosyltransferase-isomerase
VLLSEFDFNLPDDRIALRPASPRDAARLLVVRAGGALEDRIVSELPELLNPGDALVFNDTRVIPARLNGLRPGRSEGGGTGAPVAVEATLHRRLSPSAWSAFMKPVKRLRVGDRIAFGGDADRACMLGSLDATVKAIGEGGEVELAFDLAGSALDAAVSAAGLMPLPPYIAAKRAEDEQDRSDYQTLFAREDGSVAAPTAGLHFTPKLVERLKARGVELHFVTLHVGAGTFLPVKVENIHEHRMHAEWGEVSEATAAALNAVRARGGRIVPVGTTSLRLLESATGEDGVVKPFSGDTAIFITPGYRFRAADALVSNFHLPKSTLLMLVGALAGMEPMRTAYRHAVEDGYRFYSYGDAGLWFRQKDVTA